MASTLDADELSFLRQTFRSEHKTPLFPQPCVSAIYQMPLITNLRVVLCLFHDYWYTKDTRGKGYYHCLWTFDLEGIGSTLDVVVAELIPSPHAQS